MADLFPRMPRGRGSAEQRREARRYRFQVRRLIALGGGAQQPGAQGGSIPGTRRRNGGAAQRTGGADGQGAPVPPTPVPFGTPGDETPAFGCVSLSGRAREMEDFVSLKPGFFKFSYASASPMHFFAVFDGHGGSHVAKMCKERMHVILAEELRLAEGEMMEGEVEVSMDSINAALVKCFSRMDELVLSSCTCGSVGESCRCERRGMASDVVGSTAVVALVDRVHIIVANCGDSRAVLGNNGSFIVLSDDHKPDRIDELARIERAGGRVLFLDGPRVHGILAMSRAIGDRFLKQWVISEPDMTVTHRTLGDEFLIIASDGLWDVVPSRFACDAARQCIKEVMEAGGSANFPPQSVVGAHPPDSHCASVASTLARLALARHTNDNISIIVVDLKQR